MLPVLPDTKHMPAGYRPAGSQAIRVDLAEKILRSAFDTRSAAMEALNKAQKGLPKERKRRHPRFTLDMALPVSIGLDADNAARLLGSAGFRLQRARKLAEEAFGPPAPDFWTWRPRRADDQARRGNGRGRGSSQRRGERRGGPESAEGKSRQKAKGPPKNRKGPPPRKGKPDSRRPNKPDTGPARAGGAFDALADLLRK
jgi:ATP-dependent RNA helicase SUPV3L1/SUV3